MTVQFPQAVERISLALNEEIYIFVRGEGEFQVDDCVFPVSEGTTVRVNPEGERCLRNT